MFFSTFRLTGKFRSQKKPARKTDRANLYRPRLEALEERYLLSTFVVRNNTDSDPGSLRDAITRVNADTHSGIDTILFHIGRPGTQTILLNSPLPSITHPVIIDGTSQPGFNGTPVIVLDGRNIGIGLDILGGGSTVKGLVVQSCQAIGIALEQNGGDTIAGNYMGVEVTGTVAIGNGTEGDIESAASPGA